MNAKEKILNALSEVILEEGHQAVSVRSVAAKAGVNHGLVHHYFGSKEKMLAQGIRYIGERKFAQFLAQVAADGGDLGRGLEVMIAQDTEFSRLLTEFFVLGAQYPSLRDALAETALARRKNLHELMGLSLEEATAFQLAVIGAQIVKTILGTDYVKPAVPVLQQLFAQPAQPDPQALRDLLERAGAQDPNPNGDPQ